MLDQKQLTSRFKNYTAGRESVNKNPKYEGNGFPELNAAEYLPGRILITTLSYALAEKATGFKAFRPLKSGANYLMAGW